MALKGNLQKIEYIDHESELVDWVTINEQGEIVATKAPKVIQSSTDYNDVYLTIKQIDLFSQCCNDGLSIIYVYAVYESEQARIDNVEDFLYTKTDMLFNYDHDLNLYTQIYDSIKLQEGNTNLING